MVVNKIPLMQSDYVKIPQFSKEEIARWFAILESEFQVVNIFGRFTRHRDFAKSLTTDAVNKI